MFFINKITSLLIGLLIFSNTLNASEISCFFSIDKIGSGTNRLQYEAYETPYDFNIFKLDFLSKGNKVSKIIDGKFILRPDEIVNKMIDAEKKLINDVLYNDSLSYNGKVLIRSIKDMKLVGFTGSESAIHKKLRNLSKNDKKELIDSHISSIKKDAQGIFGIFTDQKHSFKNHPVTLEFNKLLNKGLKNKVINNKRIIKGSPFTIQINDNIVNTNKLNKAIYIETDDDSSKIVLVGDCENNIQNYNTVDIKSKLKELKSMLDEGLISQEQYDDKSSKVLEEF